MADHERRATSRARRRRARAARRARTSSCRRRARRRRARRRRAAARARAPRRRLGGLGSGRQLSPAHAAARAASRPAPSRSAPPSGEPGQSSTPVYGSCSGRRASRPRGAGPAAASARRAAGRLGGRRRRRRGGRARRRRPACACSSPPNGSEYWSSPAPCASARRAASARAAAAAASACRRRGRRHERASVERRYHRLRSWRAMRHILLLTDRDWTHPRAAARARTSTARVALARVGPPRDGRRGHLPGRRSRSSGRRRASSCTTWARALTVFPRAAWAVRRGLARDADVVLEVVNGITFLTPLWLRRPRVTLVHHIHRDHYVAELGPQGRGRRAAGRDAAAALLYRGSPFLTISESAARDLVALGIPAERHPRRLPRRRAVAVRRRGARGRRRGCSTSAG